ncbi:MAG: hypothetical protein MUP47_08515, partial [Phycisphaerae bacterium]|nr:hypothetical protein [Phycisphaerae bacterium]
SVEDSPNSAGETSDAIRCCKLARTRGLAGPLNAVCAYTMKHPPIQCTDHQAREMLEAFITEYSGRPSEGADTGTYEATPAPLRVRPMAK